MATLNIGTQPQSSESLVGQNIKIQNPVLGVKDVSGFHETKASIMARLAESVLSLNKLDSLNHHGLFSGNLIGSELVGGTLVGGTFDHPSHIQNRLIEDLHASNETRPVIPFRGGPTSPFLNFTSGNSSKGMQRARTMDDRQGLGMVSIDTGFNRY